MTPSTRSLEDYAAVKDVLYVAARAPRPGFTKWRLGRAIGHEQAAALDEGPSRAAIAVGAAR